MDAPNELCYVSVQSMRRHAPTPTGHPCFLTVTDTGFEVPARIDPGTARTFVLCARGLLRDHYTLGHASLLDGVTPSFVEAVDLMHDLVKASIADARDAHSSVSAETIKQCFDMIAELREVTNANDAPAPDPYATVRAIAPDATRLEDVLTEFSRAAFHHTALANEHIPHLSVSPVGFYFMYALRLVLTAASTFPGNPSSNLPPVDRFALVNHIIVAVFYDFIVDRFGYAILKPANNNPVARMLVQEAQARSPVLRSINSYNTFIEKRRYIDLPETHEHLAASLLTMYMSPKERVRCMATVQCAAINEFIGEHASIPTQFRCKRITEQVFIALVNKLSQFIGTKMDRLYDAHTVQCILDVFDTSNENAEMECE